MGIYINNTKIEEWDAWELPSSPVLVRDMVKEGHVPVCVIQNLTHVSAGVAFNDQERDRFIRGMSGREYKWYAVPLDYVVEHIGKHEIDSVLTGERR